MDRKEFQKRWIMGTIQPELFYIPWEKSKPCVFIWSKVYSINKTRPTIDECKNQNLEVYASSYDYGFMIFDEKGNVVSDTGFCVPLPKGKYYAIHYKGQPKSGLKVSFSRTKIPFEVKNDDVYIYVEETTRHYTLNVKFEPAEWKEVTARYYITQECDKSGYYELPECDENVRIASLFEWYRARGFEALEDNSEYQDLSISRAEDGDDEYWKTKWACTSAPDVRLATGYVGRNDEYTNTLSLYPNIELHKESQTKSGQKLKVKFDIIEDNLNYQCINYSIDYVASCRYKYLMRRLLHNGDVYDRICVSADRTWIATNGFFADTEGGLYQAVYNINGEFYEGIWNGGKLYSWETVLLQIGDKGVDGNLKISRSLFNDWDIGKDIDLTVTSTGYVNNWFTPSDSKFVNECYLNNRPEILDSYIGDEWHMNANDFNTFYSSPISEDHKSFESYNNTYDNKTQLTNDEIIQIYQSENESNFYIGEVISYKYYSSGLESMLPYNNTNMPYRPFISSEEMKSSGYIISNGEYESLYNDWDFYYEYRSQDDSGYVVVHYTPIRRDGFVLSKEQIYSYFNRLTNETKEKIEEEGSSYTRIGLDKQDTIYDGSQQMYTGYYLILHVDNTVKVSKEEVDDYHNGIYSENVKQIIKKQDALKDRISFIQNRFNTLYLEDNPNVNLSTVNRQSNPYIEI